MFNWVNRSFIIQKTPLQTTSWFARVRYFCHFQALRNIMGLSNFCSANSYEHPMFLLVQCMYLLYMSTLNIVHFVKKTNKQVCFYFTQLFSHTCPCTLETLSNTTKLLNVFVLVHEILLKYDYILRTFSYYNNAITKIYKNCIATILFDTVDLL